MHSSPSSLDSEAQWFENRIKSLSISMTRLRKEYESQCEIIMKLEILLGDNDRKQNE